MEILLLGGTATAAALVFSAWLMTFTKWYPIAGLDGTYDFATLIRAHVDYALMSLFNFSFYGAAMGANIELAPIACACVAIGGFTNPTIFVVAAFDEDFWDKMTWKVLSGLSFLITTIGFSWIGYSFVKYYFSV